MEERERDIAPVFETSGMNVANCASLVRWLAGETNVIRLKAWRDLYRRGVLFRYLVGRSLVAVDLSQWLDIQRNGYKLRFFPSALSVAMWTDSSYFREDEELLIHYLRPGDTVIDVGANIGAITLAAAQVVGETGRVVAIEAHPRTFAYLRENVRLNERANVDLHNVAIGSEPGRIWFTDYRLDEQNHVVTDGQGFEVAAVPLDDLARDVVRVALLKVDVEGYERAVFEGAVQVLGRTEAVLFESWERHFRKYGDTTSDVLTLLRGCGFELFRTAPGLTPIPDDYVSQRCENLLALRPPALERLRPPLMRSSGSASAA